MRTTALLLCFVSGAALAEDRAIATRITAVTVYADRAQVTRTGTVDLPAQAARFVVTGLPGWIDGESLRATLVPTSAGKILDVTVEPTFLAEASTDAVRDAEASLRQITDQFQALADEEKVLNDEIARLESLRAFTIDKLPKEMAIRDVPVKTLAATLEFVSETLRRDRRLLRELGVTRRSLEPELNKRTRERDQLAIRAQLQQSTVVLDLQGNANATIVLTYLTPGATWEPGGELRVSGGGKKVGLVQFASVVQTTGEDWEGAALSFSTQRPGEILDVPTAQGLLLGAGGAGLGEMLNKMGESFSRAQANYSSQNEILTNNQEFWRANLENQKEIQSRVVASFAQLAQRGTTAHFTAQTSRRVRADGKAVRIPIASGDFTAKVKLVAVPEVSLNAVRTAELVNTGSQAILPGKVALFTEGEFVGTSEFPFVAPGETFSTFLGVNERVKLERTIDRQKSSLERKKNHNELTVRFNITVENLGTEPITLEIADRVPVAQAEEIEVSDIDIPDDTRREDNGVVRWTVVVPPKTKIAWRIGYVLEYPRDAVERSRNMRKARMMESPAAPAAAPDVYDDIEQLEKSL